MCRLFRWWHDLTGVEQQKRLDRAEAELDREVEDLTVISEQTRIVSRSERAVQEIGKRMKHDA